jgi:hypothetical protein
VDAARVAYVSSLNEILLIGAATLLSGSLVVMALVRARDFVAHGPPAAEQRTEHAAEAATEPV